MKAAQVQKLQSTIQLLIVIGIVIAINIISQFVHDRLDLTSDKRYTLGDASKKVVSNLDDIVHIKVYLEGDDLPAGFRRLQTATKDMLDELKVYAGDKLEFEFIDPSAEDNPKEKRAVYEQLVNEGLTPVNLQVKEEDQTTQKIIFPAALIYYGEKSFPLQLLQQQMGMPPQQVLHNSITGLEYDLVNAIKKLKSSRKPKIAIITGHGELNEEHMKDIESELSNFYEVTRVNLPKYKVGVLRDFDLAIIAKPDSTFSEIDKFKIDQFVMRGGKVLWLVETLLAEMDSLRKTGVAVTADYPLNLNDQLFKYGVRINNALVQDLQSHVTPVVSNFRGTQPQTSFAPWPYFPIVSPTSNHPIVNNINAVLFRFVNPMDTVGAEGIKKTILLKSSIYSRILPHPVRINLQQIREKMDQRLFNKGPQNLAVLLEGKFPSLYKNRLAPETLKSDKYGKVKGESIPTKMIVISDGDVISNQVNKLRDETYPLGYDRFTNQTFGNKTFIMNCVDYLLDESGLIKLRSKEFKLRLLDKGKVKEEKTVWQSINMIVPVIFIILFGLIYNFIRKKRFAS